MGKMKTLLTDLEEESMTALDITEVLNLLEAIRTYNKELAFEEDAYDDDDDNFEHLTAAELNEIMEDSYDLCECPTELEIRLHKFSKEINEPSLVTMIENYTNIPITNYSGELEDFIGCVFVWEHTPQGFDYWLAVENSWKQFCVNEKDKENAIKDRIKELETELAAYGNTLEEPESPDLDEVLEARSVYGSFKDKAEWIQSGKLACRNTPAWNEISAAEKEAIDNILQKLGRVLFGTTYVEDNWVDIAGYATLVVKND